MINGGDWVLPQQHLFRDQLAEITGQRPHVAVGEFEPSTRKHVGQLLRVFEEATRDFFVGWVHTHRHVGGGHHRRVALAWIVRVGHGAVASAAHGLPLVRAGRALG